MQATDAVIAILTSDWHLSHKPPIARVEEPDWYAAMERTVTQVVELQNKYDCPLVIAGDLFDKWNPPPQLINFALDELGSLTMRAVAVPGQHDLPFHSYDHVESSAYWALELGKRIVNVPHEADYQAELHPLVFLWFSVGLETQ